MGWNRPEATGVRALTHDAALERHPTMTDEAEMRTRLSILAIPLLVAGCVGAGGGGNPSDSTAPPTAPSTIPTYSVETGSNKLILRLSIDGGLMAPGYFMIRTPTVALYGDGRVIVGGPVIAIYPGPLLPNLRQLHVTPAEIQKILAAADADGLLGPDASYMATDIMDAGTTTFTTIVDGKTHSIGAYALSEAGTIDDAAVTAARAKLLDFSHKFTDLAKFLGRTLSDAEAYAPTEMRVFIGPVPTADPAFPNPQVVTWPLTVNPTSGQGTTHPGVKCLAISGADLTAFLKVSTGANSLTVWTAPSGRFSVSVRPLYPDESGCPVTAS
jgi:hypothetical protein